MVTKPTTTTIDAANIDLVPIPDEDEDLSVFFGATADQDRMDRLIAEANTLMQDNTTLEEKEEALKRKKPQQA